jgi:hypothetical protein
LLRYPARPGRSHGLATPLATTVEELPRPDDARGWSYIPAGSMELELGEESDNRGSHSRWTGKLRKDGFYVTIETSKGERALLEIARALRPARG